MRLTLTAEDVPHIALHKDRKDFVATIEDIEGTDMVSVSIRSSGLMHKIFECPSDLVLDKIEVSLVQPPFN